MQEGPPPEPRDAPWSRQDLETIRDKNTRILNSNKELAQAQQQLANSAANALSKLPRDHPRYKEIQERYRQVTSQMPDTQQHIQDYQAKVADDQVAIDKWKKREDPSYIPPAPPKPRVHPGDRTSTTTTDVPAEQPPEQPMPNEGGGAGPDLTALKQQEAAQEAAVRSLGQQRQSAVNKYLDDPNDDNHAEAQALRQQLDGMIDNLNVLRGQVDSAEGTSRPKLHARSATAIAEEHRRRKASGTDTDGNPNQPSSGGGCVGGAPGSGNNSQNTTDNENAPHMYQEVGPGNGGNGTSNQSAAAATNQSATKMGGGAHKKSRSRNATGNHSQPSGDNRMAQTNRKKMAGIPHTNSGTSSNLHQNHFSNNTRGHIPQQSMPQTNNNQHRRHANGR
jgi:hypothetical protein